MIQVGSVGLVFRATFLDQDGAPLDLSEAESVTFYFTKPKHLATLEKSATVAGDGTDGQAQYVAVAGDIDRDGRWRVSGVARMNNGDVWPTDAHYFTVN